MSETRHYFPGNNTPEGFFSYYRYILTQREANKIICIKGGPGTGKSTFMKAVGSRLEKKGLNIDYLHCSADAESLDGIVLKDEKIARFLEKNGGQIRKTIVIKNKLVNLIVK